MSPHGLTEEEYAEFVRQADGPGAPSPEEHWENGRPPGEEPPAAMVAGQSEPTEATIITAEEFAAVDEPGADALIGTPDNVLIPVDGDVMAYGDGGAGKTTLMIDMACHLAAGEPWLGIAVQRPAHVLVIENEGPRPLLRRKLRRKLDGWSGAPLDGRVKVFEQPWGRFTLATPEWRAELARHVREHEIDVVIAGPLTRIGMDAAGTLSEVVAFMELAADVRRQCGRRLTVVLIHHENKGGAVSGAWEGSGDTLLHVQKAGNGHTVVVVQKARWSSELHGRVLKLAWTDGEGFAVEATDRDLLAEAIAYLDGRPWRTAKEVAAPTDVEPPEKRGIGANDTNVKELLEANPEVFEMRTGDDARALGRPANTKLYALRRGSDAADAAGQQSSLFGGGEEAAASLRRPLSDAAGDERTPAAEVDAASTTPTKQAPGGSL